MPTKNKTRVMATGVFDLLHPGHIYFLEQSKALGDELVVVVTNDVVAGQTKKQMLFDQESRRHLVAALACVDQAIVPTETEPERYYRTVLDINPDIITLGHDQTFTEQKLAEELAKYGWHGQIIRIDKYPDADISSTLLKSKI
jgi:FAD synthetase